MCIRDSKYITHVNYISFNRLIKNSLKSQLQLFLSPDSLQLCFTFCCWLLCVYIDWRPDNWRFNQIRLQIWFFKSYRRRVPDIWLHVLPRTTAAEISMDVLILKKKSYNWKRDYCDQNTPTDLKDILFCRGGKEDRVHLSALISYYAWYTVFLLSLSLLKQVL